MKTPRTILAALVLAALSTPAWAQRFGVELEGGYFDLAGAQRSAQAVFDGSRGGAIFGGALRFVHRKGFYVAGGARFWSKDGERVFLASSSGPVQRLGFPLSLRLVPITGTVGYRFRHGRSLVPYAGVGGGVTLFREESDVTGDVRTGSQSVGTFLGEAGVEYGKGPLRFAVEGSYSIAGNAVGVAGVSKVYGEDDVGGWTVLGKIVFAFGKRATLPSSPGPSPRAGPRSPASSPAP